MAKERTRRYSIEIKDDKGNAVIFTAPEREKRFSRRRSLDWVCLGKHLAML